MHAHTDTSQSHDSHAEKQLAYAQATSRGALPLPSVEHADARP